MAGGKGAFADANVGTNIEVKLPAYALTGDKAENYQLSDDSQKIAAASITAAALSFDKFTVDTEGKTYQASQIKPTVAADGYTEGTDYTVAYGENVNAGEGAGTITITGIGNYAGQKEYSFDINKKQVTITGVKVASKEYDRTDKATLEPGASLDGVIEGDTATLDTAGATCRFDSAAAGENKKVTVSGLALSGVASGNYSLPQEGAQATTTASIYKKKVGIEWAVSDSYTYNGQVQMPSATATGVVAGDAVYVVVSAKGGAECKDAGSYTAEATGVDNTNYELDTAAELSKGFTIGEKEVTVGGITAASKKYDGTTAAQVDYSAATFDGIVEGDKLSVSGDGACFETAEIGQNKKVKLPDYQLGGDDAGNYLKSANSQSTAVASITVDELDFSKFTVDTKGKTYQASQIKPTVAADGYTEGTDYTVTYGENFHVGGNAGTITIVGAGNYSGQKEYTFNINKQHVTVTGIKAADREYDGTTEVDLDCSGAQVNGLCEGDTLTVVAGGELDNAAVGERTATLQSIELIGENSWNYGIDEWTSIELKMQVTKRTAELTWYDTSFTYDKQQHCPVASVSNSVDGEVLVVTVDGGQTAAGTYAATATALDDDSYKLPENPTQEFTISPSKVSVSGLSAESKTYDGTDEAMLDVTGASLDGVIEGDDVALDATGATCKFDSADAGENKKVTISGLALSGAANGNYSFAQKGMQLTTTASITKKPIGVAWTGEDSYTYNGKIQMPSATATGVVASDAVNVAVSAKGDAECKDAGNYTAEATGVDNANYELDAEAELSKGFTIGKKEVTVGGITAASKKYDTRTEAQINYSTATFDGIIEGDRLSVSGDGGYFESAEIGQNKKVYLHEYTLGGADAANYYMSNSSQNVAYANITEQELDDKFFSSDESSKVYSKTQYTPAVTCSNPDYVEGRDYKVSYDDNTDVGVGNVYVEGIGNYGGFIGFDFNITPKEVDVVWSNDEIAYDGNAHLPTATASQSDVIAGDTVDVSVKTVGGQDAIEIGEYAAEAASQNKNYVVSDGTKTHPFTIVEAKYCTVSFSANGHVEDPESVTIKQGEKVSEPEALASVAGLKFEGWYTQESCLDKWDFSKPVDADITLYANWVPDSDADAYWISPASKITTGNTSETANQANKNYKTEEWCVKKSSAEIKADVAVLRDPSNADYEKVKAEYEALMKDDAFHLYTKWTGDTSDYSGEQAANAYVEFRIIQVGNRNGETSDGALTFQAIHELPTSWQMMQTSNTNKGGWGSSELQAMMNPGGEIYANFNTALTDEIAAVPKKTYAGYGASTPSYSCNYFWLPSYSELSGTRDMHYEEEGLQYAYYGTVGVSDSGNNPALTINTRAGNSPVNATSDCGTSTPWWTRSSNSTSLTDYKMVDQQGNAVSLSSASNAYYGVVPCFSFGKRDGNLVTFDMQNHGSQVKPKYVLTGNTVPQPDYEDYGRQQGLKLEGWYTSEKCRPSDKWDFSNTVDTNMTLYANWVLDEDAKSGNSYWIGTSYKIINEARSTGKGNSKNYVSETNNVLKTQEEIMRDVAKIKKGDQATIAFYTEIMNSDAYHLYTKWNGETKRKSGREDAKLGYVEFRIIGVGSHDGDGSGLTFQAIHTLQFGYKVNDLVWGYSTFWNRDSWVATNRNGWEKCTMREAMSYDKDGNAGLILKNFSQGLIDDIYRVQKKTTKGSQSTDIQTTRDILWNLSYVEVSGYSGGGYGKEGTQYQYFKNIGVSRDDSKTWGALVRRTRAWDKVPAAISGGGSTFNASGQWWLRTPHPCCDETYIAVGGNGTICVECDADFAYGVCPAFCL